MADISRVLKMDLEKIKELIDLVEQSNIAALSVEIKDLKVEIKKEIHAPPSQQVMPQVQAGAAPAAKDEVEAGLIPITSPMVGTFYRSPSPDAAPYVEVGDEVTPGKVVCIIEAMKLFNDIEAEVSGTVVRILAENGKPVEYGQTLILLKPRS